MLKKIITLTAVLAMFPLGAAVSDLRAEGSCPPCGENACESVCSGWMYLCTQTVQCRPEGSQDCVLRCGSVGAKTLP